MAIIGHEHIVSYLKRISASGNIPHAMLFYGPGEIGKKMAAIEFFKTLYCESKNDGWQCAACAFCRAIDAGSFPDMFFLTPRRKEITIEEIRKLRNFFAISSVYGSFKTCVIDNADRIGREAANALLKTIEEPPQKSCIILVSDAPFRLPETIRSRLQQIRFSCPISFTIDEKDAYALCDVPMVKIRALANRRPGRIITFLEQKEARDLHINFLRNIVLFMKTPLWEKFTYIDKISKEESRIPVWFECLLLFLRDALLYRIGIEGHLTPYTRYEIQTVARRMSLRDTIDMIRFVSLVSKMVSASNANPLHILSVIAIRVHQLVNDHAE